MHRKDGGWCSISETEQFEESGLSRKKKFEVSTARPSLRAVLPSLIISIFFSSGQNAPFWSKISILWHVITMILSA